MRLSVIVPVLDERDSLPRLLDFLRAVQDHADCEVVIVDGGSRDGTLPLLRAGAVPWIVAERGRASQMNAGASATRGETLVFLHADTEVPDGWDRAILDAVAGGAVGGFFRVRLDSGRPVLRLVGRLITARSRLTRIATGDQVLWVERRVFEELGGYSPLPLFEDVELTRRLKGHGRVAALDATVVTSARRWEQAGPWRTILGMWLLRALFALGMRPERLARYYGIAR